MPIHTIPAYEIVHSKYTTDERQPPTFALNGACYLLLLLLSTSTAHSTTLPHQSAEANIKMFDRIVNIFLHEYGRYPSQAEGLYALVNRPADIAESKWEQPYLKNVYEDPWGADYVYRFPGIHNRGSFDLYSLGKDGISKTGGNDPDDINNWNTQRPWARHYARPPLYDVVVTWAIVCGVIAGYVYVFWRKRFRNWLKSPSPRAP